MDEKLVRLIDVERWILTESACIDTPADRDAVVERMRYSIPAVDAVEVVRCRKCKHWETDWPPSGFDPDNPRYFCSVNDIFPTGDWFCKDGERREYSLYESLKRGLEEAIAYENGENELRTEIREEGDAQWRK